MKHSDSEFDENSGARAVPDPRSEGDAPTPSGGRPVQEILSSRIWKILIVVAVGLIASAWFFSTPDPLYESHAKLLVHYVLKSDETGQTIKNGRYKKAILNDEIELLKSWDLVTAVAGSGRIDLEKLLPDTEGRASDRAVGAAISEGLDVQRLPDSKILLVSYQHADPDVPVSVLGQIIERYFEKHMSTHRRDSPMLLEVESAKCRNSLRDAERAISETMGDVFSIESDQDHLVARKRRTLDSLVDARADLAMQEFRLESLGLTPDNADPRSEKLPDVGAGKGEPGSDAGVEIANYRETRFFIEILQAELEEVQARQADLAKRATTVAPYLRTKAAAEARIAALDISLAEVRKHAILLSNALRNGLPNIVVVESPTPPARATPDWGKRVSLLLASIGIVLGFALALMIVRKLLFRPRRAPDRPRRAHAPVGRV